MSTQMYIHVVVFEVLSYQSYQLEKDEAHNTLFSLAIMALLLCHQYLLQLYEYFIVCNIVVLYKVIELRAVYPLRIIVMRTYVSVEYLWCPTQRVKKKTLWLIIMSNWVYFAGYETKSFYVRFLVMENAIPSLGLRRGLDKSVCIHTLQCNLKYLYFMPKTIPFFHYLPSLTHKKVWSARTFVDLEAICS